MLRHRMLALAAVVGVALAACGGSTAGVAQQGAAATVAAPSTAPTTMPFPDVVMPEQLRGIWIAHVERPGPSTGIWRLRVTEHLMEMKNPAAASDDDYFWMWTDRIDGKSFHLAADGDCPEITYSYTVTGDQLVMTTTRPLPTSTDDVCGDPVVILTTPFKRDR